MKINIAEETTIELNLTITKREASVLYTVMGSIGGAPEGPREVTDGIYAALDAIGIRAGHMQTTDTLPDTWKEFEDSEA